LFLSGTLSAQTLEDAFVIAESGLLTQKLRMNLVAENVANMTTLEDESTGLPYQKRYAVLEPDRLGVRVVRVEKSTQPFLKYYDPAVPQSNVEGFVSFPNVNLPDEMVVLAYTETIFEANATTFKATKAMVQNVLDILK
jgi:flagellar basal-body rod protein FlgC